MNNSLSELQQHFQSTVDRVQKDVLRCLAFKTDYLRMSSEPRYTIGWEQSGAVVSCRESLTYRISSVVWHVHQLDSFANTANASISHDIESNDEIMRKSAHFATFLFDDVVFNAVSVFDYLSELLYSVLFPDIRGNTTWSALVKKSKRGKLEDPMLAQKLQDANSEWVKKLGRYRGTLIHNKAHIGPVESSYDYMADSGTIEFSQHSSLSEILDSLDTDASLSSAAVHIALKSLDVVEKIVSQLGSFPYRPVYSPH